VTDVLTTVLPLTDVLATTCCCVVPLGHVNDSAVELSESRPVPVVLTFTLRRPEVLFCPMKLTVALQALFVNASG
jgi:hypothetical protein